jgi:hypothetical protein
MKELCQNKGTEEMMHQKNNLQSLKGINFFRECAVAGISLRSSRIVVCTK